MCSLLWCAKFSADIFRLFSIGDFGIAVITADTVTAKPVTLIAVTGFYVMENGQERRDYPFQISAATGSSFSSVRASRQVG